MDTNVLMSTTPINPQGAGEPIGSYIVNHHKPFNKLFLLLVILIMLPITFFVLSQFKGVGKSHNAVHKFELTESSPVDQDGSFSTMGQPTFVFSKPVGISENNLSKYFNISPNVPGN